MPDAPYTVLRNEKTAGAKVLADAKARADAAPPKLHDSEEERRIAAMAASQRRTAYVIGKVMRAGGVDDSHADVFQGRLLDYYAGLPEDAKRVLDAGDDAAIAPHVEIMGNLVNNAARSMPGLRRVNPIEHVSKRLGEMSDREYRDSKAEVAAASAMRIKQMGR